MNEMASQTVKVHRRALMDFCQMLAEDSECRESGLTKLMVEAIGAALFQHKLTKLGFECRRIFDCSRWQKNSVLGPEHWLSAVKEEDRRIYRIGIRFSPEYRRMSACSVSRLKASHDRFLLKKMICRRTALLRKRIASASASYNNNIVQVLRDNRAKDSFYLIKLFMENAAAAELLQANYAAWDFRRVLCFEGKLPALRNSSGDSLFVESDEELEFFSILDYLYHLDEDLFCLRLPAIDLPSKLQFSFTETGCPVFKVN